MSADDVAAVLDACERSLAERGAVDLAAEGFWPAVAAVKRSPQLTEAFAGRIGSIDRAAFTAWAPLIVPLWAGLALLITGALLGLLLVGLAYYVAGPWNGLLLLAGAGALAIALHGPTHFLVGSAMGIQFVAWFATARRIQPGLKTDYASYLHTPARQRAWMHASGALVTKAVPFLLIPAALAAGVPGWALVLLIVFGVTQIGTDVAWSVRTSDWKKYRREMRVARDLDAHG